MTGGGASAALPPPVARIIRVAEALGPSLTDRVVFIGGAILPLLVDRTDRFGQQRPTKDVDGVVLTDNYTQKGMIDEALRERGFRHKTGPGAHIDRWRTPSGETFDLTSCGEHPGGTGNKQDRYAIDTKVTRDIPPRIHHVSQLGFLLLKWGAYRDRGHEQPQESKDLSDITVALLTCRQWKLDLASAPEHVRLFLGEQASAFLASRRAAGTLGAHVDALEPLEGGLAEEARGQIESLAQLNEREKRREP